MSGADAGNGSSLFDICRSSGGSMAGIESVVRAAALATPPAQVNSGGVAVSSQEIQAVSRLVSEVWQSSGGSRAQFEEGLRTGLGALAGGKKFLASLALLGVLQTAVVEPAMAFTSVVSDGQSAVDEVLPQGATQYVGSGGLASNITASGRLVSGGYFYTTDQIISSGGTAISTTVADFGAITIRSGGSALDIIQNSDGIINVAVISGDNKTVVNGINSKSELFSLQNGIVSNFIIADFGYLVVSAGGSAINIHQEFNAKLSAHVDGTDSTIITGTNTSSTDFYGYVSRQFSLSNGVASNFMVVSTVQNVISGGSTINTDVRIAGSQIIGVNGLAKYTKVSMAYGGESISSAAQIIKSGGSAEYTSVYHGGKQLISSGGQATSTLIYGSSSSYGTIYAAGIMEILSGGSATNVEVWNTGRLLVSAGGVALNVSQRTGGVISAVVAPANNQTYISGTHDSGTFSLSSNVASNFILNSGAVLTVLSGGSAIDLTLNSGSYINVNPTVDDSSTNVVRIIGNDNSTYISGINASGQNFSYSGGIASNFIIYAGAIQHISSGGSSFKTELKAYATQIVSNGGSAISTLFPSYEYATLTVESGGTAIDFLQNSRNNINTYVIGNDSSTYIAGTNASGSILSLSNGIASNFILYAGGYQHISSGGSSFDTILLTSGIQIISNGGSAIRTIFNSGISSYQEVQSGGLAISATLSTGSQAVHAGGSALNTVLSGARQYLSGIASSTTINSSGYQYISSGGSAYYTTINSYGVQNIYNGYAYSTVINEFGLQSAHASGTDTYYTIVNSKGMQIVHSLAKAHYTTVNSGGELYISKFAYIDSCIIKSGGSLIIASSAGLSGVNYLEDGYTLDTSSGSILYFQGDSPLLHITTNTDKNHAFKLDGSGSLAKSGTGALTLTAANTFTGPLSVEQGALVLGPGGSLATSAYELGSGTVLNYQSAAAAPALRLLTVNGFNAAIVPGATGADLKGAAVNYRSVQPPQNGASYLSVAGAAEIDASTAFAIHYDTGRANLGPGESVVLLSAQNLNVNDFDGLTLQSSAGDTFLLMLDPLNPQRLLALMDLSSPFTPSYERLKPYLEARAGELALLNQGQDLLLGEGIRGALSAVAGDGFRLGAFGGLGGGWSRYTTGSHVDVKGGSLVTGLALGRDLGASRLVLGVFLQAGRGDYDTFNDFPNANPVVGRGSTSFLGAGLLARHQLTGGPLEGLYLEASTRFGRSETDFRTGDILYNGRPAEFETSSPYFGLHAGVGRVLRLGALTTIDLGAKLVWMRQGGDSFRVNLDDVVFDKARSLRARLGGRLDYRPEGRVSPFLGAYVEREFDGAAKGSVNGVPLASPSLKGTTVSGELGLALRPSPSAPVTLDLGVQGFAGKRRGVSGNLTFKIEF
jgi:autotransporter-associated beta strand protein/autotransporter passenger strand-loop-strand repeat protein